MSADIAAFMIRVDGEIQSHQLDEVFVLTEAELVGKVVGVILVLLHGGYFAIFVDVAVDSSGDGGQLGDEIH